MRATQSEINAFKYDLSAPSGSLFKGEGTGQKPMAMPGQKVMVKNHRVLGPAWRELMSEFRKLNSHGAAKDKEAFGVGSNKHRDPPSRHELNESELSRKRKTVPAIGHHGARAIGKETFAVGAPRTTAPKEADHRAPPHSSYFHEPASQPTQTKSEGASDELRKRDAAVAAIKRAFSRPYGSPDEI